MWLYSSAQTKWNTISKSLCVLEKTEVLNVSSTLTVSLPVIYKSSKNTWMTHDIFLSLLNEDFEPAVKCYLCSQKLNEEDLLLLDAALHTILQNLLNQKME